MPPPFNIDSTSPAPSSLIGAFPANEQANRGTIEEWLSWISDPVTGMIRSEVIPISGGFETGTKMVFIQSSAPTGWVKDTTHNDKALRIVNGTVGTGGSVVFSTAFSSKTPEGAIGSTVATGTVGGTAITTAQMPSHYHGPGTLEGTAAAVGNHTHAGSTTEPAGDHTHSYVNAEASSGGAVTALVKTTSANTTAQVLAVTSSGGAHQHIVSIPAAGGHGHTVSVTSGATAANGSGATHTHTFTGTGHTHTFTGTAIDLSVQYVDCIIATKE